MTSVRAVRRPASTLPTWLLAPTAALGGLAASAAFAPVGWWPMAFVAVAALDWVVRQTAGWWRAVLLGWVFGLAFMATSLVWQTSILILSYTGLTLVTSVFYAAVAGLIRVAQRLPLAPLWAAGSWVIVEWALSVFPFDGFAWMRLGYSQVDSPLAGFYPFTGAASVTFLVALIGHLLAWGLARRDGRGALTATVLIAAVLGLGGLGRLWQPEPDAEGTVNVGWVQGGAPGGGVYGLGTAGTITANHAAETAALVERVDGGELPQPDFVVWPENSTDIDATQSGWTRSVVEQSVARVGAPILVGTILDGPGEGERQTSAIWWTAQGPGPSYEKRNLVPFGEWIPFRDVLLPLIPQLIYVGSQSVPGTEPGAIDTTLPDGRPLSIGVAICYEVIYPHTMYQAVDAGAQLFVVQSSNAMYQGTNQIDQQFAITRVRAAEMRTPILVVTTSGVSGRINADGSVAWTAPVHVGASGVESMTLANHATPVMRGGALAEPILAALTALALAVGLVVRRLRRPGATMGDGPAPGGDGEG